MEETFATVHRDTGCTPSCPTRLEPVHDIGRRRVGHPLLAWLLGCVLRCATAAALERLERKQLRDAGPTKPMD